MDTISTVVVCMSMCPRVGNSQAGSPFIAIDVDESIGIETPRLDCSNTGQRLRQSHLGARVSEYIFRLYLYDTHTP